MNTEPSTTETGDEEPGGASPAEPSDERSTVDRAGEYRRWPPPVDLATIVVFVLAIVLVIIAFTRIR